MREEKTASQRNGKLPAKRSTSAQHDFGPDADMLPAPTSLQACAQDAAAEIVRKHKDTRCGADQPLVICGAAVALAGVFHPAQSMYLNPDIFEYYELSHAKTA